MVDPRLAVTGTTGHLGGRLAHRLAAAGVEQRLIVRDPTRAPRLPGAIVRQADYADGDAVRAALDGAETVFMVSASESLDRLDEHRTFVDAAAAAGVRHLVYTSFFGASPTATFTLARDHWATEQHIRASGLAFTFLRDNLYADFLPSMVGPDGVIRGPAADGRAAVVAQHDIADVAAVVLRSPHRHTGVTYDLTGPESLTLHQIVAMISAATRIPVSYHAETLDEAYRSRSSYGAPGWQVEAWVTTYTAIAAGEFDAVSDAIPRLLGRAAMSLQEVLAR